MRGAGSQNEAFLTLVGERGRSKEVSLRLSCGTWPEFATGSEAEYTRASSCILVHSRASSPRREVTRTPFSCRQVNRALSGLPSMSATTGAAPGDQACFFEGRRRTSLRIPQEEEEEAKVTHFWLEVIQGSVSH